MSLFFSKLMGWVVRLLMFLNLLSGLALAIYIDLQTLRSMLLCEDADKCTSTMVMVAALLGMRWSVNRGMALLQRREFCKSVPWFDGWWIAQQLLQTVGETWEWLNQRFPSLSIANSVAVPSSAGSASSNAVCVIYWTRDQSTTLDRSNPRWSKMAMARRVFVAGLLAWSEAGQHLLLLFSILPLMSSSVLW